NGQDEARGHLLRRLGPDVEPHRRVEAEHLMEEHPGELVLEDLGVLIAAEVAVLLARAAVSLHYAIDELAQAPFSRFGPYRSAKILRGDDGRGVDRPGLGELDPSLLEDGFAGLPVLLDDIS